MALRNGGFYVGELQAGYGVFGMKMSVPVVGADLRDWMWSTIAYGARAVNMPSIRWAFRRICGQSH